MLQIQNAWHALPVGPNPPEIVYAVIEVPKGSRNKYEYSKSAGVIKLDRVLYSPLHYPGDYGFIPQTYCDDGDPLDILVMMTEPTFPGCVIEARPIGMLQMIDGGKQDIKILAVPDSDAGFVDTRDLGSIPKHFPAEVEHFFLTYKQLQGATVESRGWAGAAEAKQAVNRAMSAYRGLNPAQLV